MMAYYSDNKTEHAFRTFAGDLKNGFDYPVVYMYGPEEYLIDWAANTVAGKYVSKSFAAADLEKPDTESVTMEDIVSSCETVSMFSDRDPESRCYGHCTTGRNRCAQSRARYSCGYCQTLSATHSAHLQ